MTLENPDFKTRLTEEKAAYDRQGYLVVNQLIPEYVCDKILALSEQLTGAKNGDYSPVMMPHRQDAAFLEFMKLEEIVVRMRCFLDGDVSGLQSQFFFTPPGTKGFSFHQDNHFVQAPPGAFGSAWLALTDISPENGGLIVVPDSHREGMIEVRDTNAAISTQQDPNAYRVESVIDKDAAQLSVTVKKGSVVFIHGLVVHASHNNDSKDKWRHVLLNTYIRKGEAFRAGRDAKRTEICLDD